MITTEQSKEITKYLLSKKLPIDLILEVKDHMIEQIENMEVLPFEEAFEKVKLSWKKEMKMVFSFRLGIIHRITQFQNKIGGKINKNFFLKSISLLSVFIFFSFLLGKNNFNFFEILMTYAYYTCISITAFIFISNFKVSKSTFFVSIPKINIFQRGANQLFTGGIYMLIFNNLMFNKNEFLLATYKLFNSEISTKIIFETLLNYIYLWMWLFGLLYFLAYKKSIKELQKRINLEL